MLWIVIFVAHLWHWGELLDLDLFRSVGRDVRFHFDWRFNLVGHNRLELNLREGLVVGCVVLRHIELLRRSLFSGGFATGLCLALSPALGSA